MEEWVQAASFDVTVDELIDRVTAGIDPLAAVPWWALSGLVARRLQDGADQPLWRAWATALLVQPDLRRALPDDVPRRVLDRLRMTSRERLRALWWHADQTDRWERLATLEQLGRSSDRRRRWSALDEASVWAPSWAWDVSRVLADGTRPGRNQEVARIAAWEAHHLISNGGELALIGLWLRAAGEPPPDPVAPEDPSVLRLGQAARLLVVLGPGDVPARSEHLRLAGRAAGAVGGWAQLRGYLDALDLSSPDARRALRAAVGAVQPKALLSRRAWNALRTRLPRLPEPELVGVGGEPRKRAGAEEGAPAPGRPRRRRRRRLRVDARPRGRARDRDRRTAAAARGAPRPRRHRRLPRAPPAEGAPARKRRRRRRRPRGAGSGGEGAAPPGAPHRVSTTDRSEAVADDLWARVRTMAARVAALEEIEALGELDEEGQGRLAVLRMRCTRAAGRARMADELADQMADVQRERSRRNTATHR